nr:MAG TPA: Prolactin receptor domain, membrane protein, receptor [Caudoviricetes sp.]
MLFLCSERKKMLIWNLVSITVGVILLIILWFDQRY